MIRRDLQLAEGRSGWLLVSQVSHARLSGELAARCPLELQATIDSPPQQDELRALAGARSELLAAISHHDDGWDDWDLAPKLDTKHGRPLSFLEMPRDELLPIWDRSVEAAGQIGPLAAWAVAGHFLRLLDYSQSNESQSNEDQPISNADQSLVAEWRRDAERRRAEWFGQWAKGTPLASPEVAERIVDWLQIFDVLSLWLCGECPLAHGRSCARVIGAGTPLATEFRSLAPEGPPKPDESGGELAFQAVTTNPWRFSVSEFVVQSHGHWVPAHRYSHVGDLLAARIPFRLQWRLLASG